MTNNAALNNLRDYQ